MRSSGGWMLGAALGLLVVVGLSARAAAEEAKFALETFRGHVVFMNDALHQRFGITTVPEAAERTLALQTVDGTLIPIIEDVRGRAFRVDERLRKMEVELLVRRYRGAPGVQVIRLYDVSPDGKHEVDYWCHICAIAMVELKACECCQGETELRRQKASD